MIKHLKGSLHQRRRRAAGAVLLGTLVILLAGCATTSPDMRGLRLSGEASTAYHSGDLNKAESLYRQLLKLEPENAQGWYRLGNIAMERGRLDEAVAHYKQALSYRPDFPRAKHNLALAYFRRGAELLKEAREGLGPDSPVRGSTNAFLLCLTAQLAELPGLCPGGESASGGGAD